MLLCLFVNSAQLLLHLLTISSFPAKCGRALRASVRKPYRNGAYTGAVAMSSARALRATFASAFLCTVSVRNTERSAEKRERERGWEAVAALFLPRSFSLSGGGAQPFFPCSLRRRRRRRQCEFGRDRVSTRLRSSTTPETDARTDAAMCYN